MYSTIIKISLTTEQSKKKQKEMLSLKQQFNGRLKIYELCEKPTQIRD